jgi:midasin
VQQEQQLLEGLTALLADEKSHAVAGRFEWVDGELARAVAHGGWVLLDNANLCNPAVLDRLNSLLEPDGGCWGGSWGTAGVGYS